MVEYWSNVFTPSDIRFRDLVGACPERKPKDRFFARLASEIFLSSLQTEFSSALLETIAARSPALNHGPRDPVHW